MLDEKEFWKRIGLPEQGNSVDWPEGDAPGYVDVALAGVTWLKGQGLTPGASVAAALLEVARRAAVGHAGPLAPEAEKVETLTFEFKPSTPALNSRYQSERGHRLWALINSREAKQAMKAVARLKRPAILGLEPMLLETGLLRPKSEVGEEGRVAYDLDLRLIGQMVKQVMKREGAEQGARKPITGSQIWGTGTYFYFPVS